MVIDIRQLGLTFWVGLNFCLLLRLTAVSFDWHLIWLIGPGGDWYQTALSYFLSWSEFLFIKLICIHGLNSILYTAFKGKGEILFLIFYLSTFQQWTFIFVHIFSNLNIMNYSTSERTLWYFISNLYDTIIFCSRLPITIKISPVRQISWKWEILYLISLQQYVFLG